MLKKTSILRHNYWIQTMKLVKFNNMRYKRSKFECPWQIRTTFTQYMWRDYSIKNICTGASSPCGASSSPYILKLRKHITFPPSISLKIVEYDSTSSSHEILKRACIRARYDVRWDIRHFQHLVDCCLVCPRRTGNTNSISLRAGSSDATLLQVKI